MERKFSFEAIYSGFLAVFALMILVLPKPVGLCFAVFGILVIVGMAAKKMKFKADLPGLLLIAFYLIYIIYIAFTRNPDWAGRYAENKLSFILLPLLFFFRPVNKISFRTPLSAFVIGSVILFVAGLYSSFTCYSLNHAAACFVSSSFSPLHHPTYASVFYTFSAAILICGFKQKWKGYSIWICLPLFAVMIAGITMCISLAGVLYMMIFFAAIILFLIYRRFGKLAMAITLVLMPALLYFVVKSVPRFEGEYSSAKHFADQYTEDPSGFIKTHVYPNASGSEVRLIMWTAASQCFAKYPLGVGTGNVDGVLAYKLQKLGQKGLAKEIERYNPHNQYLQTGLETGIFGLLILLSVLICGTVIAFKKKNWLLVVLLSCFAFNMLFESMLQRQSGIVFFSFALCLLMRMTAGAERKNN